LDQPIFKITVYFVLQGFSEKGFPPGLGLENPSETVGKGWPETYLISVPGPAPEDPFQNREKVSDDDDIDVFEGDIIIQFPADIPALEGIGQDNPIVLLMALGVDLGKEGYKDPILVGKGSAEDPFDGRMARSFKLVGDA
jgi:hypothetical protein